MSALLTLLAITLGPLLVTGLLLGGLRRLSARVEGGGRARRDPRRDPRRNARRGPRRNARRDARLARLLAELGRLEREHERVRQEGGAGSGPRLAALLRSYDLVLASCCRSAGLPAPRALPLDAVARLEVEAALAARGLTW